MNILKEIKDWWKPEVKEASTKATVRFKNGAAIYSYSPAHAGDLMLDKVHQFTVVNQNREARAEMLAFNQSSQYRSMLADAQSSEQFRQGTQGNGIMNICLQQSYESNMRLSDREMGRLI